MNTNKYLKYKNKYLNLKKQHGGINKEKLNELLKYKEQQIDYINNFESQIMGFVDNELIEFIDKQKELLNMIADYLNEIKDNMCSVCNPKNVPIIFSSEIIYKKPSCKPMNQNNFVQSDYILDQSLNKNENEFLQSIYSLEQEQSFKKKDDRLNELVENPFTMNSNKQTLNDLFMSNDNKQTLNDLFINDNNRQTLNDLFMSNDDKQKINDLFMDDDNDKQKINDLFMNDDEEEDEEEEDEEDDEKNNDEKEIIVETKETSNNQNNNFSNIALSTIAGAALGSMFL